MTAGQNDVLKKLQAFARDHALSSGGSKKKRAARSQRARALGAWRPGEKLLVWSARDLTVPVEAIAKALKRKDSEVVAVGTRPIRQVSAPPKPPATADVQKARLERRVARRAANRKPQRLTPPGRVAGGHSPTGEPLPGIRDLHLPAHDWLIDD